MASATTLKTKRIAAGIAGQLVCTKLGFARSKLSSIERDYSMPTSEELIRIDAALDEIVRVKSAIQKTAAALGWPIAVR